MKTLKEEREWDLKVRQVEALERIATSQESIAKSLDILKRVVEPNDVDEENCRLQVVAVTYKGI